MNYELMWIYKELEWKSRDLMYLERATVDDVKPHLPIRPIPRTAGFLHLTENDPQSPVRVDYIDHFSSRLFQNS